MVLEKGDRRSRRQFLADAAGLAGAAMVASGILAGTAEARAQLTRANVEFSGIAEAQVPREAVQRAITAVNALNKTYPGMFQKIVITRTGMFMGTAGIRDGVRSIRLDLELIRRSDEAVLDIVAHEAGHMAEALMYGGYEPGTSEHRQAARILQRMNELFVQAITDLPTYGEALRWFYHEEYLSRRTRDEGANVRPDTRASELFANVFATRYLYGDEYRERRDKGAPGQKAWADEFMSLLPQNNDFLARQRR